MYGRERQYALAEAGWRVDAPEPKNFARFLADHDRSIVDAVRSHARWLRQMGEEPLHIDSTPDVTLKKEESR